MAIPLRPFLKGQEVKLLLNPGGIALRRYYEYDTDWMKKMGRLQWQELQVVIVPYKGERYLENVTPLIMSRRGEYLSYNFSREVTVDSWLNSVPWKLVGDTLCIRGDVGFTMGWEDKRQFYRVGDPRPQYKELEPLRFPADANKALYEAFSAPLL